MNKLLTAGIIILILVGFTLWSSLDAGANRLSREEAVQIARNSRPELKEYGVSSLPPSSVDAERTREGWSVGFIRSGSGIASILDAQCFFVSDEGEVTKIGEYARSGGEMTEKISLETCRRLK